ncbi:MAG: hypothetical protein HYT76_00440 [Deltaproteobacteria bacterium]|nr:hypothetical protein [Deltaproteobacteria bacterium]
MIRISIRNASKKIPIESSRDLLCYYTTHRERRKALGGLFFDVAKYLLTTIAVGSFLAKDASLVSSAVAIFFSFVLIVLAFYITPQDGGEA